MDRTPLSTLAVVLISFCGPVAMAQEAARVLEIVEPVAAKDETAASRGGVGSPEKPKGQERPQPHFHFRDKSKVAGQPDIEHIAVATKYGELKVPVTELVQIRFAERIPADVSAAIEKFIAQLGAEDFDARVAASEELEKIGAHAIYAVKQATKSSDEEVKKRAKEILKAINAQAKKEAPAAKTTEDEISLIQGRDDEIVTTRMTIKGRVTQDQFVIQSRYGTLSVDTSNLAGIVFRSVGPTSKKVTVAPSFQPPGNWLDTKLTVERGQRLRVSATGQTLVSNYSVSATPDGASQYSTSRSFGNFPVLSLIGKIGRKGKPFLVGSNFRGKASGAGKLYLAITPFYYYPQGAGGSYKVKIDAGGG